MKRYKLSKIVFDTSFSADYGQCVRCSDLIRRLTVNNPGPFTFHGTNTYLVGNETIAVIDPGPEDSTHIKNIIKFAGKDKISHIFVTHTHMDHSPGARLLQSHTGAPIIGAQPHFSSRPLEENETNPLENSADLNHQPNEILVDKQITYGKDWTFETVSTPGHTANHLSFALQEENTLFSGDHVMAWSTSIVAPPDGSMSLYMNSLRKLQNRTEQLYFPGHGGPVTETNKYLDALISHRLGRESAIIEQLTLGEKNLSQLVAEIYKDTPKTLHGAASLSLLAHIEDLIERKIVTSSDKQLSMATFNLV